MICFFFIFHRIRRCLFQFKPPDYSKKEVWDKFHDLIKAEATLNHYAEAAKVIIPVLAEFGSMNDAYKVFRELIERVAKTS